MPKIRSYRINELLVIIGLAFFAGMSCSLEPEDDSIDIIGEGEVKTFVVDIDTFISVTHICIGDLKITRGDSLKAVIRAQQNIFDLMKYPVDGNGALLWAFRKPVNIVESKEIVFEIQVPVEIRSAQLVGLGNIELIGEKQDYIYLELVGTGNITTSELIVDDCEVELKGMGNIFVNVNNLLQGRLSGQGIIYYKGDPTIEIDISGQGSVREDK